MSDWHSKEGKLIVDGNHYTYWNSHSLTYVRDGGSYTRSRIGPHFLDLGVMGHCRQNCHDCYMRSKRLKRNMPWDAADNVVYKFRNSLCQVSYGGAGDPMDYEEFSRLNYIGNGRMREAWEKANPRQDDDLRDDVADRVSWHLFHEPLSTIARCITINPRGRAFTPSQVRSLAQFKAVGLSCGEATGFRHDDQDDIVRLIRQAEEMEWRGRPRFVLHLIVTDMHNDLRRFIHLLTYDCVQGVLFLAKKRYSPRQKDGLFGGPFYNREMQNNFWKSVAAVHDVVQKSIAVDSCFAPLVDRELFPNFDPAAMHPCDAGRFSAYVHADRKMWLCSCGAGPVKSWEEALQTKQFCKNVFKGGNDTKPPLARTDWPNPPVVIQHGPMTNSSSASYFVIVPKKAKTKLDVLDFVERENLAEWDYSDKHSFNWYEHNKRLVKVTLGEWASWCAEDIAGAAQSSVAGRNPAQRKKVLDSYTKRLLAGGTAFYLVANRDDDDVPPIHYNREDVSDDKRVILIRAGEEH